MCEAIRKIWEKGWKEGREKGWKEGMKEGREEVRYKFVVSALQMKLSFKTIKKLTGLSLESISSIAHSIAMV